MKFGLFQACNCDSRGAVSGQCDELNGRCSCRVGYSGEQCNSCARGYYGFPRCRPCDCDKAGTKSQHCPQGVCVCDDVGQCPCKVFIFTFSLWTELLDYVF